MKRMPAHAASAHLDRRGFVLIIVMVIVAMVAFAGFAFVNTMSDEYRAVHTNGDLLAAEQALASAELMLLNVLDQTGSDAAESLGSEEIISNQRDPSETLTATPEGLSDNPQLFQEQLLLPERPEEQADTDPFAWRFSIVSPNRSTEMSDQTIDAERRIRFGLENESARLNLSMLMTLDAASPEKSREVLMAFPGMTEAAADSLLDWLDADDEPREFGAEAEDYLERPSPYQPRNGLPTTLEELLLVREVRRSSLFGPDANRNFTVEPHEVLPQEQLDQLGTTEVGSDLQDLGWADLLTLHSAERNVDSSGKPRIDLNQLDENSLRQQLSAEFPAELVEFIIQYRQFGPAGSASSTAAPAEDVSTTVSATGPYVQSVADFIDASVSVTDGSAGETVNSPVTSTSTELLAKLLDRTTADFRDVIPGRININLATRPVLLAIPGIDEEVIPQILARRSSLDDEAKKTPAWLLTEQILTIEQFRQALPHITTGGDVFRAQLIAWRPAGGPYRRVEVMVERTQQPAKRIAWNDLSAYGTAISIETLSASAALGESMLSQPLQ